MCFALSCKRYQYKSQTRESEPECTMKNQLPDLPVVSSLVIQAFPKALDSVTKYVNDYPNAEIYGSDFHSKFVVVVEMSGDAELSDFMSQLGAIEGVITVNMVFHHTDTGSAISGDHLEVRQNA